jgi:hypothetical protein
LARPVAVPERMVVMKNPQIKKAYSRPQLVKHGNVEKLTLSFNEGGCSFPIKYS